MIIQGTFDFGPASVFTTSNVAEIVEVSTDDIDYWVRKNLIAPHVRASTGSGSRRLFSIEDLMVALFVKRLRDEGWSCKQILTAVVVLGRVYADPDRYRDPQLIHDGNVLLVLCRSRIGEPVLFDAVRPGQTILSIALETLAEDVIRRASQYK